MKPRMKRLCVAAASVLAAVQISSVSAQPAAGTSIEVRAEGAPGIVHGVVRESGRGASLPGALVTVGGRSAVTTADGSFRISGLEPGRYELVVNYLGYQAFSQQVTIAVDAGLRADLTLAPTGADAMMDRVEVRATREGQALALNQQRRSVNYQNIVSADLLGRFPATNLAEATQRIPGVSIERDQGEGRYVNVRGAPLEFTSVSVDGVQLAAPNPSRRAVELDTIPPDAIATLQVTKALTPDMDADAIAGQINIVTQSALDRRGPIARVSLAGGRFELGSGANDRGSFTIGNQLGANRNIGALLTTSWSRSGRFTDNVESEFFIEDDGRYLPEVSEIKDYEGERSRFGVTARFDFRLDENNLLYLIGSSSKFRDNEYRNTFVIEYENHTLDSDGTSGVVGRATFDKELRERIQDQRVGTLNFGGEHYLTGWALDWQTSFSQGRFELPRRQQYIYRSTVRPRMAYDYSDPDFPTWTLLNPDDSVLLEGINLPEDWYAFRRYNQRYEYATEEEIGLRLNLSREQKFLGDDGEISFGVRARTREKLSNDDRSRNGVGADGPPYADLLCPRVSNNFGRFEYGRVFCNDIFDRFGANVINSNFLPLVEASIVSDYEASEDINGAYVRLDASWGDRLSMITGLRYEKTDLIGEAPLFDLDTGDSSMQRAKSSYGDVLPSLHFRYSIADDTILRASWSTGISRPNFPQFVPSLVISDDDRTASAGNPDLDPTFSNSFDVSFERYLRPLGLISVAAFYKRLDDPIFVVSRDVTGGSFDGLRLTQPANGSDGRISGVEVAWQQIFERLRAPFDGLGVYANYTYTDSSATAPFGIGSTDLPGTSRDNVNFAVFYEKFGLNARLAYNYRSAFIQEFNLNDSSLDTYWDKRPILDFTTSYQFGGNWQVFSELANINDSRQRRYQGARSRVLELEEFGRTWLIGLRYDL